MRCVSHRTPLIPLALAVAALAGSATAAQAATLEGRALLPADATAPAPFDAAPNTDPVPAPGSKQPVGGFSAIIKAPGQDTFYAMPDNGFGTKANSRSFLLRVYRVKADFERRRGAGDGTATIRDAITLSDPDRKAGFPIVNEATTDRLLTGADFDIESFREDRRGDLWFGEEFGPFLLHTDSTGKLLEAPIPTPGVQSPDNPLRTGPANLASSNGFEGMALSQDGRRLFAVLEGPVAGDPATSRRVFEFDLGRHRWTDRRWTYEVADPSFLVSDFTVLQGDRFVSLERDNLQGTAARHKKAFVVRLDRPGGTLPKREVADLLNIADPFGISPPANAGDIGIGDPFAMPYITIEAVLPTRRDQLTIVNDTNFGSTGRNPNAPDPSDFIQIEVPELRDARSTLGRGPAAVGAVIGDTPYGDAQFAAFPRLRAAIDADPAVGGVVHLGDTKNGSSSCASDRLRAVRDLIDGFRAPVAVTPGDNDWTDCHRANNGGFLPTDRLEAFRRLYYRRPGRTLGRNPARIETQADTDRRRFQPFVENQRFQAGAATVALLHVVGSANDLEPWFGTMETPGQRQARVAEFEARNAANLRWLDETFREARRRGSRGVVLAMQADTFINGPRGFEDVLDRIRRLAAGFDGPVLLLQGDTHVYATDTPIPNVTRIVVQGETVSEWLRVEADPSLPGLFSWTREAVPAA
jgi:hypothetical protein